MNQNITTDLTDSTVLGSPAVEMINKRLRTQRKRLTKIEKYEALDKSELNNDQLETIQRRPEVTACIKELEELLKQFIVIENDANIQAEATQLAFMESKKTELAAVVAIEKETQKKQLQAVARFTYAFSLPINSLIGAHPINETEFNALAAAKAQLSGSDRSLEDHIELSTILYTELVAGSAETFPNTYLTFEEVSNLVDRLLAPVTVPKFGNFGLVSPVESMESFEPVHQKPSSDSINFLNHDVPETVSSQSRSDSISAQSTQVDLLEETLDNQPKTTVVTDDSSDAKVEPTTSENGKDKKLNSKKSKPQFSVNKRIQLQKVDMEKIGSDNQHANNTNTNNKKKLGKKPSKAKVLSE
ncbi:hypothetical protein HDV02_006212 [Globomyces sp. JEL0801]|nr:hypothetical protein HDV02_006212 [Globomyces sp. JEL0801]